MLDSKTKSLMWTHRELRKDPLWLLRSFQSALNKAQDTGELSVEQAIALLQEELPAYTNSTTFNPHDAFDRLPSTKSKIIDQFLHDLDTEGRLLADVFGEQGIHLKSEAAAKAGSKWKDVAVAEHVREGVRAIADLWQAEELRSASRINEGEYGKRIGEICARMDGHGFNGIFNMSKANPAIVKFFMEDTRRIAVTHNLLEEGGRLVDVSELNTTVPNRAFYGAGRIYAAPKAV